MPIRITNHWTVWRAQTANCACPHRFPRFWLWGLHVTTKLPTTGCTGPLQVKNIQILCGPAQHFVRVRTGPYVNVFGHLSPLMESCVFNGTARTRQLIIHKVTQSSAHGQYRLWCGLVHLSKMGKTSRAEWVFLLNNLISAGLHEYECFFPLIFVECHAWNFHD